MIRALVVDDEAPARAKVVKLLAAEPEIEVVGEAADGEEAVERIRELAPDLVFLDVQMPRLDGFGVIAEVGVDAMPRVVFVTAYDDHALEAFEVHAFDYLLKPFSPARFRRVLERVRRETAGADLSRRLDEVLRAARPRPSYLRRILVKKGDEREVLLPLDQVDVIRSERNYLRFVTPEREYRRRGTLTDLVRRLDPERFLRVSRSEVVRLDAIRELQPWFHGDYRVVLHDGTVLTWSRRYRAKVKDEL